ncbi:MAG: IS1595 family transposase [Candidatus Kapaibacterium sp.]
MDTNILPKTLLEAVQYFSDNRTCVEFVRNLHWPDGNATCFHCGSAHVKALSNSQLWKCYDCKKKFSVKMGTIFEKSPLPLSKWLPAMWLLMNAKNGVSSCEIARSIGVCQKTAWFMMHRIREAMRNGSFLKLSGVVEADETFIGGNDSNRHADKKHGGRESKSIVMGMVQRKGNVVSKVIDNTLGATMKNELRKHVAEESVLYTDESNSYNGLGGKYYRDSVNHFEKEFVRGDVHTNTIENYWSLFKRTLKGTYIHVAPFHLDRYLDEQAIRYNLRKGDDGSRFEQVASQTIGRRLTWKELTGQTAI